MADAAEQKKDAKEDEKKEETCLICLEVHTTP
jgi:hypothetical protein